MLLVLLVVVTAVVASGPATALADDRAQGPDPSSTSPAPLVEGAPPAPAGAASGLTLVLEPQQARPGDLLVATAGGFAPGTSVTFYLGSVAVVRAEAAADGTVRSELPIPDEVAAQALAEPGRAAPDAAASGSAVAPAPIDDGPSVAIVAAGHTADGVPRSVQRTVPAGWRDLWLDATEPGPEVVVGMAIILLAFVVAVSMVVGRHHRRDQASGRDAAVLRPTP